MGTEMNLNLVIKQPWTARQQAYVAQSWFPVGVPLLFELGDVFTGRNVESASFEPAICAERVAAADDKGRYFLVAPAGRSWQSSTRRCGGFVVPVPTVCITT